MRVSPGTGTTRYPNARESPGVRREGAKEDQRRVYSGTVDPGGLVGLVGVRGEDRPGVGSGIEVP